MNKIISILIVVIIGTLPYACQNEQKPTETEGVQWHENPNGDSELALLMREMYEDGARMRKQIENGETPTTSLDYEAILNVQATQPEKQASQEYHAFSEMYFQAMQQLNEAEPERAVALYDHMVNTCQSCHEALCPGPLRRIKHLEWPVE